MHLVFDQSNGFGYQCRSRGRVVICEIISGAAENIFSLAFSTQLLVQAAFVPM
jgi:hypothetical protein